MAEQKRVFIAIDISDEARRRIRAYAEGLRRGSLIQGVKWERPEKLHLTLKFLGDTDAGRLGEISDAVKTVADRHAAFTINIAGTGVFPGPSNPRILWLGTQGDPLSEIAAEVEDACERLGFERDKRAFNPHLTIARLRGPQAVGDLVERHLESGFEPVTFEVSSLRLYESQLLRTGSVYTLIADHKLCGPPA